MNTLSMNKKIINVINECKNLEYELNDNDNVIINYYNVKQESQIIGVKQKNNSKLVINIFSICQDSINFKVDVCVSGNNNETKVNARVIAENKMGDYRVNIKTLHGTHNNIVIEDLKGLLDGGNVNLMPILEVECQDVDASHFATIGGFSQEEMFYLQSKGLSEEASSTLLKKSFMYSLFNDDFIKLINK